MRSRDEWKEARKFQISKLDSTVMLRLNAPSNRRPPKNSKNLINARLAVDGTEDDLISCFKEGKKCAGGRALLQAQMENLNDRSLHENPFDIVDEDVIAAAPHLKVH